MPRKLMFLLVFLAAPLPAADVVYDRSELEARLAVVPAAARKSGPELLDSIVIRLRKPGGDPVNEFQLRRDVLALELPLNPVEKDVVSQLAARAPSIRVWHEGEGHARVAETALDAGAAARWVLRESAERARAQDWYKKNAVLPKEEMGEPMRHLAATVAVDELPALRPRLEQLFKEGAPVEDALVIVAVRAQDAELAKQLLAAGDIARVRRHVSTLHDAFPSAALSLLSTAMDRPELAPHAIPLLGQHSNEDWAWQALENALEEPALAAASAATIARHADEAQLAAVAQLMVKPAPVARRAALTLYLNGSSYARQLLAEHREHARESELAREIDTWLRD